MVEIAFQQPTEFITIMKDEVHAIPQPDTNILPITRFFILETSS